MVPGGNLSLSEVEVMVYHFKGSVPEYLLKGEDITTVK
jgi:hypothetical protein